MSENIEPSLITMANINIGNYMSQFKDSGLPPNITKIDIERAVMYILVRTADISRLHAGELINEDQITYICELLQTPLKWEQQPCTQQEAISV